VVFLLFFYDISFPAVDILQNNYSFKGITGFRRRMSPNQNTSDDTWSRRQSHTVSPDTTASSEIADSSAQIIRSPVALNIRRQLPSFITTDSEHIQTQGQDAKDTTALPIPAGMRDSEREEISN
jgi:hypothetical protein